MPGDLAFTAPIASTDGTSEFDSILSSINAAIGGYLNPARQPAAAAAPTTAAALPASNDLLVLAIIGLGVFLLLR
jgi:hypothetical protein